LRVGRLVREKTRLKELKAAASVKTGDTKAFGPAVNGFSTFQY